MKDLGKTIGEIVKGKNAIIRREREKLDAAEWSNRILSAYIALLASGDELRIRRDDVSSVLGSFRSEVLRDDDCYVIRLKRLVDDCIGKSEDSGGQQI